MRIALLAMTEDGDRAAKLAGQPVAWHQLHAALAAGCERIVCLANAPGPELAALQREAERHGARFHAVAHPRALSGLVHAADTLYVLAPGVFVDREWLVRALGGRAGVAVLSADRGLARGFERVDRDHAWAGVLATRGDAVEVLAELPPDADPAASLLRIALQRGARKVDVPEHWLDDGHWANLPDAASAARFEPLWYATRVPSPGWARPSDAASYRLAQSIASGALMRWWLAAAINAAGMIFALGGAAIGYLGFSAVGLALLAIATLFGGTGTALARFAKVGSGQPTRRWPAEARAALFDLSFVAIAASPGEFAGWATPFAALTLLGAIRLAREPEAPRLARGFGDRTLVFAAALGLAIGGLFAPGIAVLALVGLLLRLFGPRKRG